MTTNHSVVQGRELKSCPFCGGLPYPDHKAEDYGYYPASHWVRCTVCGASTSHFDDGRETALDKRNGETRAGDAWNTRSQLPIPQGRDECSEAFEQWCSKHFPTTILRLNETAHIQSTYDSIVIESHWLAWQAAWQRAQTPREGVE